MKYWISIWLRVWCCFLMSSVLSKAAVVVTALLSLHAQMVNVVLKWLHGELLCPPDYNSIYVWFWTSHAYVHESANCNEILSCYSVMCMIPVTHYIFLKAESHAINRRDLISWKGSKLLLFWVPITSLEDTWLKYNANGCKVSGESLGESYFPLVSVA